MISKTRPFLAGAVALQLVACAAPSQERGARHSALILEATMLQSMRSEPRGDPTSTRTAPVTTTEPAHKANAETPAPSDEFVTHANTALAKPANVPVKTHPAALELMSEAARQEQSGDLDTAAAKLERALRIEPRSALLWNRLAELRLRQGQVQLAANLAAKSNSLVTQDTELTQRNQRIIQLARDK